MRRGSILALGLLVSFLATSYASAVSTVTLTKTHLCCKTCVKDATAAVAAVPGAAAVCVQDAKTITVTAPDDATAQKAVDALVAAGFYGEATGATIKDDSGAPTGTVTTLTISDIHNCCGKCAKAINGVIKSVPGATGEIKAKETTVTVTGSFDAQALVKALNDAGFSVKAK
jgi:mercuric ion binding protein